MDQEGKVIHRLFGKWHEGLYCGVPPSAKCIWRPGSFSSASMMLKDHSEFSFLRSFVLTLLARFHAYRLWNVLRLHQIRHRAERALSWAEGRPASHRCQIQTRSKAAGNIPLALKWGASWLWSYFVLFCWFRYLEEGNLEMAASEKQRIEEGQRLRRKWNEENNIKHEPRFFK